jgi:proline racemase
MDNEIVGTRSRDEWWEKFPSVSCPRSFPTFRGDAYLTGEHTFHLERDPFAHGFRL